MTKIQWFNQLKTLGFEIAREEKLNLKSIELGCKSARGRCHTDGRIELALNSSPTMELRIRQIEDLRTLAHELAHLKHFHHDKEFWEYAAILCKLVSEKFGIKVPTEKVMI